MTTWILVFVGLLLGISQGLAQSSGGSHSHHHHAAGDAMDQQRPDALRDDSVYQLEAAWTDQDGKKRKLPEFKGKLVVTTLLYTSCKMACPIIISDLQRIEDKIPAQLKDQVQFVLFTMDSKRDTPAKLKEFAKQRELDLKRWTLLTASEDAVREVAAVFGIRYKKDQEGEFSHSNVISVLDREGVILHQQVGLRQDPASTVAALKKAAGK